MVAVKDIVGKNKSTGKFGFILARVIARFLQFVMAITVTGLYGTDLNAASKAGKYMDPKWMYAVLVGGIAALTTVLYGLMWFVRSELFFAWDWILFVLWTVVFGIFGHLYIPANPTPEQGGQIRMKHAVWIDLINMVLWFTTAVLATHMFWRGRKQRQNVTSKV